MQCVRLSVMYNRVALESVMYGPTSSVQSCNLHAPHADNLGVNVLHKPPVHAVTSVASTLITDCLLLSPPITCHPSPVTHHSAGSVGGGFRRLQSCCSFLPSHSVLLAIVGVLTSAIDSVVPSFLMNIISYKHGRVAMPAG
jgi:hypothetical protein